MLSRGLHFTRSTYLGDEWEGAFGEGNIRRLREEYFGRPHEARDAWEAELALKRSQLARVGVSCWHDSPHESAALWDLYMPQGFGVAVRSTSERLTGAVEDIGREIRELAVSYSDYSELDLPNDPDALLSQKRVEFSHEREVRFVLELTDDEIASIDLEHRVEEHMSWRSIGLSAAGVGSGLVYGLDGIAVQDGTALERATPYGVHLPVDFLSYVDGVHLAPRASRVLRVAVRDALDKFGVDVGLIADSSASRISPDRLKIRPESPDSGAG